MRHEKIAKILRLARALASNAEGMTLDQIADFLEESRSTAERVRRILGDLFPDMDEILDHPHKRFRIPNGLDSFFQSPSAEELACLGIVIESAKKESATDRVSLLTQLDHKIRAAIKLSKRLLHEHPHRRLVELNVEDRFFFGFGHYWLGYPD